MAQTIKLKRSAVSGNTPSTSDLELGEIAINTYDGKVFIKKNDGSASVVEVGAADNTKLPLTGGTMTGAINMGGNNLTNLATLSTASGNLTLDSAGTIVLDADNAGVVQLKDGGSHYGSFFVTSDSLNIQSNISDADIIFKGSDGGSGITALTLDMSDGGSARFAHDLSIVDNGQILLGAGLDGRISSDGTNLNIRADNGNLTLDVAGDITLDADGGDVILKDGGVEFMAFFNGTIGRTGDLILDASGDIILDADGADVILKDAGTEFGRFSRVTSDFVIKSATSDKDIIFKGNDGGSTITALTLDMSEAGAAIFSGNVTVSGNLEVTGTTTQTGSIITNSNFTGLSDANSSNATDFGFYGKYVESSTTKYAGVYYDASVDNTFKFFCDTQTAPTTTVNESATGYALANVQVAALTATGSLVGTTAVVDNVTAKTSSGSIQFKNNSGTELMRLTNGGSLAIGTGSAAGRFHSYISATRQLTHNGNGADLSIMSDNNTNPVMLIKGTGTADLLNVLDNTTEVFTILDGGNVGIGNSSPSTPLVVQSNSSAQGITVLGRSDDISQLDFDENDGTVIAGFQARTTDFRIRSIQNIPLLFMTNNTERARIDASGTFLFGKTEDGTSNAGHVLFGNGAAYHIRSGGFTNFFNRTSSDGEILRFAKDGSTAGSIGANGGDLYVGTGDTNVLFADGSDSIIPANTGGASRDNAIDLGASGTRFKDLHLSGHINMLGNNQINGGTGLNLDSNNTVFRLDNETEIARFVSTGLGIGTTSPSTALEVNDDAGTLATLTGISSGGVTSVLMKQSRGTIASPSNSSTAGDGNYLVSQVYNSGYASIGNIGIITGSAVNHGVIQFQTANSGTVAERMRIDNSGRVSIGSSTGASAFGTKFFVEDSSAGLAIFHRTGSGGLTISADNDGPILGSLDNADSLRIFTGSAERMRISNSGQVGINRTSFLNTNVKLEVGGADNVPLIAAEASGVRAGLGVQSSGLGLYVGTTNVIKATSGGAVTFNSAFTFPTADGSAGQVLKTDGSGNLTFQNDSGGGSASSSISDSDGDTKIQVEESSDEDKIRLDIAGTEKVVLDSSNFSIESGGFRVDDPGGNYPFAVNAYGFVTQRSASITQLNGTNNANVPLSVLADVASTRTASYVEIGDIGSAANRFKIDNTGAVVINTTGGDAQLYLGGTSGTSRMYLARSGTDSLLYNVSNGNLRFGTNNTERMRIASNGPFLFLGHTGHSWGTFNAVAQIGRTGFIANYDAAGTSNQQTVIANNTYYGASGYTSIEASTGSAYMNLMAGDVKIFTAPATTAGSVQTFTERLTLTNTGNVGIGTTAPSEQLHVLASAADILLESSGSGLASRYILKTDDQEWRIGTHGGLNDSLWFYNATSGAYQMSLSTGGDLGLGVGSSTPTERLTVSETSSGNTVKIASFVNPVGAASTGVQLWLSGTNTTTRGTFITAVAESASNDHTLRFGTSAASSAPTERMRIDASGNVGIANSSPSSYYSTFDNLVIGSSGSNGITVVSGTTGAGTLSFADGTSGDTRYRGYVQYNHNGDKLALGVAAGDRVTIDSLANVGIGTTSPNAYSNQTTLTINGTTYGRIDLETGGIVRTSLFSQAANTTLSVGSGFFTIDCGGSERVRLDTSGNLIVGKTATTFATQGAVVNHNGTIDATRSGDAPLYLNRLASNGNIIALYQDSASIGNIGTYSQDSQTNFFIAFNNASQDVGLGFGHSSGTGRAYYPCRENGSGVSAAIDLGTSTYKYKDLHLSGTANVGGNLVVTGNLTINGTTTTLNTATLDVEDKNITINYGTGDTSSTANGAGITIQDAVNSSTDATILWNTSDDNFEFSHSVSIPDATYLNIGSSDDLQLIHNGTHSFINNNTGSLYIRTPSTIQLESVASGNPDLATFAVGGAATLYYNGSSKFATTSGGASVTGTLSVSSEIDLAGDLNVGDSETGTTSVSTSATTTTNISSFSASTFRSAKYLVQVTNSTDSTYHTTEILVIHDGTDTYMTEYGSMFTGAAAEATFTSDISSGSVRLLATPASTDSMTFKVLRNSIIV